MMILRDLITAELYSSNIVYQFSEGSSEAEYIIGSLKN